jgi:two-component system chemotaxis family response regulator WspR
MNKKEDLPTIESFRPARDYSTIDSPGDAPASPAPGEVVVLLVDDQEIVARAVHQLFAQDPDISFHYCPSPQLAVEYAESVRPTVILQDLVMPDISGLDLVRKYRATPSIAEIPIIVLSTREDPVTKSRAFAEGANDYLVKLPDRIELVARARYHSRAYRALTELRDRATRDGLTGVWNRKMIFDTLAQELGRAGRESTPLAIIMVDLDRFKSINDTFGHAAGDAVLQQAARRLSACIRSYDHVGRYGGDEFLIVLPNCDREQAATLSERLCRSVAESPMDSERKELHTSCSIGVASTDTLNGISVAALMQAADEALYLAKQAGRNCFEVAAQALPRIGHCREKSLNIMEQSIS